MSIMSWAAAFLVSVGAATPAQAIHVEAVGHTYAIAVLPPEAVWNCAGVITNRP